MSVIGGLLPDAQLQKLKDAYVRPEMTDLMRSKLVTVYDPSDAYVEAIKEAFYGDLPPDSALPPRDALSVRDRERCIIALLAARDVGFFLALHIYVALMELVSAEEIAHIIFLAGIYTGVGSLAEGLRVEAHTLNVLKKQVDAGSPLDVEAIYDMLQKEFGG